LNAEGRFAAFLALTLLFLGLAVATGLRRKRRAHLVVVACAIASLGASIAATRPLGALYDFESAGRIYPVHLFIAKTTAALYLLPIATGALTLRRVRFRALHSKVAFLVLGMTVVTAATGMWLLLAAERRASQAQSSAGIEPCGALSCSMREKISSSFRIGGNTSRLVFAKSGTPARMTQIRRARSVSSASTRPGKANSVEIA